jgi:ABC-type antimicrobial peptide transport system permease subunit
MTVLLSALAVLAIFLTCIGLAGIVAQAATLRRKELGIRIALGANRRTVVHALIRDVRWALLAGIIFGVFAGVALGGIFSGVPLFVKPFDPPILLAASLLLAAVATVAAVIPAWRALRADVVESLRSE